MINGDPKKKPMKQESQNLYKDVQQKVDTQTFEKQDQATEVLSGSLENLANRDI